MKNDCSINLTEVKWDEMSSMSDIKMAFSFFPVCALQQVFVKSLVL